MINDIHKNPSVFKHLIGAVAVGGAILLGFVLGLWVGDHNRKESQSPDPAVVVDSVMAGCVAKVDTTVAEVPQDTVPKVPEVSETTKKERAAGIEYLTKHNRWNRDEMEEIPALQGLWDAVNHYDLETIRKYAEVMECPPLTAIVEGLETSHKTGYYASKNDRNITLSTYIRRLQQ
jgi:hypothetical protein